MSNEVNRITAGIHLAAAQSTKSLLTGKSVTGVDVHLTSEEGRPHRRKGWSPGQRRGKGECEQARVPGVCADARDHGGVAGPQEAGGRGWQSRSASDPLGKTSELTGR